MTSIQYLKVVNTNIKTKYLSPKQQATNKKYISQVTNIENPS